MKKSLEGGRLSFKDYTKGSPGVHLTGVPGSATWNMGMSLSIIASGKAGFAISYGLGQGCYIDRSTSGCFCAERIQRGIKIS